MLNENSHLTDHELLLAADGELSAHRAKAVRTHLSACWHCHARMSELESAIVDFVRVHHQALDGGLPPIGPSRAQFSARLSDLAVKPKASSVRPLPVSGRAARERISLLRIVCGFSSPGVADRAAPTLLPVWSRPHGSRPFCRRRSRTKSQLTPGLHGRCLSPTFAPCRMKKWC